eukprot:3266049-Amphidinium_carterae.2
MGVYNSASNLMMQRSRGSALLPTSKVGFFQPAIYTIHSQSYAHVTRQFGFTYLYTCDISLELQDANASSVEGRRSRIGATARQC